MIPESSTKPLPPSEGPEKRPAYLEHEWAEEAGWSLKVNRRVDEVFEENSITYPYSEAELKAMPVNYTAEEAANFATDLPQRRESEAMLDKEGHLLGVFLPDGLSLP